MKYRIVSNGMMFRVQYRHWWYLPGCWTTLATGDYGESPVQWATKEAAQEWVDLDIARRRLRAGPWVVVATRSEVSKNGNKTTNSETAEEET